MHNRETLKKIKKRGFTLIELLVVISIIMLLSSIIEVNVKSSRSKARFAQVLETMNSIGVAANLDYNDNNNYATDVGPNSPPRFVSKYLKSWPTPPCSGWTYDWENWIVTGGIVVRITLRRPSPGYGSLYYYCIADTSTTGTGNCEFVVDGKDIKSVTNKKLDCNE
ncbi:MAG: type II secretion system protein [Candidatus Paceibacterota bacterium]